MEAEEFIEIAVERRLDKSLIEKSYISSGYSNPYKRMF